MKSTVAMPAPQLRLNTLTIVAAAMFAAGMAFSLIDELSKTDSDLITLLAQGLLWPSLPVFLFGQALQLVRRLKTTYTSWCQIPKDDRSAPLVITLVPPLLTAFGVLAVWTHFGLDGDNFLTRWSGLVMGVIWIVAGLFPPLLISQIIRGNFAPWCLKARDQ